MSNKIQVHVGTQVDGFTFCLSPRDMYRLNDKDLILNYPNSPKQIFIGFDDNLVRKPEDIADRWLIIASMLTSKSESDVLEQGFEIINMPSGETIKKPKGTKFLGI